MEKRYNSRIRQEYIDQDYIDQLSDKEKEFLSNFNEEFYGGNFKHKGKKLHKSKKSKRTCYGRNNSQNRCVFGIGKAKGNLVYNHPLLMSDTSGTEDSGDANTNSSDNIENALVELIDKKNDQ